MREGFNPENKDIHYEEMRANTLPNLEVVANTNEALEESFEKSDINKLIEDIFAQGTEEFNYKRERDLTLKKILQRRLQDLPHEQRLDSLSLDDKDRANIALYIHDFLQEKRHSSDTIDGIHAYLQLVGKLQ